MDELVHRKTNSTDIRSINLDLIITSHLQITCQKIGVFMEVSMAAHYC